jgi:hypothetical protein
MAFGRPVDEINPTTNEFLAFNSALFTEQVWFLADELNAGIDEVTATVEAVPAKAITRSSITCCALGPRRDNDGAGRDGATVTFSSRSKRCGPSAASTQSIGPRPYTAGH